MIVALGDRAVRFEKPAGVSVRALVKAIRAWPDVRDCVVAREHVAVFFAHEPRVADTAARVEALAGLPELSEPVREHVVRAIYDGADLAELGGARAIELHTACTYTVEWMGFLPGFAYLVGLPPELAALPRRATPRPRVPAGSIGIAGGYTGVYPFESSGGWHLIGRVLEPSALFSASGALLAAGDRVRFEVA